MSCSRTNDFRYVQALTGHTGCVNALAISRNIGRYLATGSDDKRIILHDLFSANFNHQPAVLHGHENNVFSIKFGKQDNHVYSCGLDGFSFVYDLNKSNRPFYRGGNASEQAYKIDVKKDNDNLFAVASTQSLELFDLRIRAPYNELACRQQLSTVNYHPIEQKILIASMKGKLDLLDERKLDRPYLKYNTALRYYPSFFQQRASDAVTLFEEFSFSGNETIRLELPISNATFNYNGELILASPLFFFPTLYRTSDADPQVVFYARELRHVWTMKNFNFGGPYDKMILAGSDKKLGFFWHLPDTFCTGFEHAKQRQDRKQHAFTRQGRCVNQPAANVTLARDVLLAQPFNEAVSDTVDFFSNSSYAGIQFRDAKRSFEVAQTYGKLLNAKGMINSVVMHSKMPLIFTAGVENIVHVYSNLELGHITKSYNRNSETLNIFEQLLQQNNLNDLF
ncbi:WD40 repeat protein [Trachipleistophora hominis]|uniref:WD40 repeat protein n=1 Tax=Trachipleistophora hominis TaxID=72359 RepID=L7JZ30_TRAHO|nr:WD40 repeat protein [Trachipleistophora hominis]